jgi:two-component system, NarL family, nitrate/nitrite response regulator NarL
MNPDATPSVHCALLIEDDPVFQDALGSVFPMLADAWSLACFDRGQPALQWLQSEALPPELMLVDIGLPDISGIEVIRAARARYPDLPIMVVSVIAKEATLVQAIRAGANGYLLKGESLATLRHSIQDVLAGNYPISPALARHLFRLVGAPASVAGEPPPHLSAREVELLHLLSDGKSYAECADAMCVALSTVQSHVRNMYRKLDVNTQMQAVSKARRIGVL